MTYKVQIDDLVRDATADEITTIEANLAAMLANAKTETDKATAKSALLDRLGITAEEATLLLG
jgi:hypothetical protein